MPAVADTATNKKMTEAAYRVRRTLINERVEAQQERVAAYRDQELAKLFYDSGWTQQELADKEGKSKKWVDFRTRFGRFINWANIAKGTTGTFRQVLPTNFTERSFRALWEQTSGTKEDARFRKVLNMIKEGESYYTPREKTRIKIVDACSDGELRSIEEITKEAGVTTVEQTQGAIGRLLQAGLCVKVDTGQGSRYAIRKGEGRSSIDTAVLKHAIKRAQALIRSIIKSATGDEARYSATGVALNAGELRDIMNELKTRITPGSA